MKQTIIILTTIYVFFNSGLSAQNIDKMNKSELRDYNNSLTTKIDSLINENFTLQNSLSTLSKKSSLLEQENNSNQIEISRLNELILKNENERKRINSENESTIAKLNEKILVLRDSMSIVHSTSNDVSTITTFNNNDFLNKYYFEQVPLPNNSFSLVLTKLIYGDILIRENRNTYPSRIEKVIIISESYSSNYDEESYNYSKGGVNRVPEILDSNNFTFWGVQPNVDTKGKSIHDLVFANTSSFLDSKLPEIEILKNKLFTLKYVNGTEESFLFNSKKNGLDDENNQRGILQIELANENVREDGGNNTAKDMVWRFFIIGNECYLALNNDQLIRIGLMIQSTNNLEYFRNGHLYNHSDWSRGGVTSGNGIYLSRNKDSFMESSEYINPENLIYLFKLK